MLRFLMFVLGISPIFIYSTVNAQKTPVELSNLENRSFTEDREQFFPQASRNSGLDFSEESVGQLSREESEFDFLGEDIIIETEDIGADSTDSVFEVPMTGDRSNEVQILLQIQEW
jgi:hypothetical protein